MSKKLALVAGGTSKMGEAVSIRLYDAGYTVVVTHSPDDAGVGAWLERMADDRRYFHACAVDVTDYRSCQQCTQKVRRRIGLVDVLVNYTDAPHADDFSVKRYRTGRTAAIRAGLDAVFNMTESCCAGMVERGWGRIVNVLPMIATRREPDQPQDASVNPSIIRDFTKSLAREVAIKGVTVNTVCATYLAAGMMDTEEQGSGRILKIPVGRFGLPDEVAALVRYLCSHEASFVTGLNMTINGNPNLQ